ncbi:hypothetical protein QCA50_014165 [Cerrena zonata]|uniref:Uncharacterized protein n=1 Tax=Cerrena zonata TaxID=2478898 RepID=A0AAW0FPK5_9APHY
MFPQLSFLLPSRTTFRAALLMPYSDRHNIAIPPHPRGRKRYVSQQWVRDVNGPVLPRPPPCGVRTPNGLIWGHDLTDFMWIKQLHDINVFTVWSRSMIKEFGENYDPTEWEKEDGKQVPRRRHPWPVLKLPRNIMDLNLHSTRIGIIDQGCKKHRCIDYSPKYRHDDDDVDVDDDTVSETPTTGNRLEVSAILGKLIPNIRDDEGLIVINDEKNPLKTSHGLPYTLLWAGHVRSSLDILFRQMGPLSRDLNFVFDASFTNIGCYANDSESLLDPNAMLLLDGIGLVDISGLSEEDFVDNSKRSSRRAGLRSKPTLKEKFANLTSAKPAPPNTKKSKGKDTKTKTNKEEQVSTETPLRNSPYSVEAIPKLEEFLPKAFYPDVLMVHDPHHVVLQGQEDNGVERHTIKKYLRVLPKFSGEDQSSEPIEKPEGRANIAHLYLHEKHRLGTGNHSAVYQAPLTLPPPLSAHSRNGNVTVAAKLAFTNYGDRQFLNNEATIYNKFPQHLMDDWCGYNFVPPIKHPVPVGPVVPKFYGYYLPEGINMNDALKCNVASPILLMEECGKPVEPEDYSLDKQSECFSLIHRLHKAGFVQNSPYLRNMVVQPGPLTVPPEKRSMKYPSFRIIDFGRGQDWDSYVGKDTSEKHLQGKADSWYFHRQYEAKHVEEQLGITEHQY